MGAVLLTTSILGITAGATTAAAQDETSAEDPSPFTSSGTIELELIDQTFDLAPDGNIELTYRVTGDLAAVAELAPPTTTTTTTSTSTTSTTTTTTTAAPAPDAPPPDDTATGDPAIEVPTATAPPAVETPVTEPSTPASPPVPLTVRVLNYEPLDDPDDLAGLLGPDPRTSRFPTVIDGVDFFDARALIDVERPEVATMRLTVSTDAAPSVADRLEFLEAGIHPILVQVRVDDQVVARHGTVVERRSRSAPPPIDLSFIASIDDPGPTADSAAYEDAIGELGALLGVAAVVDAPITLDIPPSVAAAAVESGNLRDDASDILLGEEVLASPATPFDVSSAVAVDRVDAFVRQLSAGEDDMRSLLEVVTVRDLWLATEPLSADAAQVLRRQLGVRYLAMPSDVYVDTIVGADADDLPERDHFVDLELPDGSTMPTLIIDDEFGASFEANRTDEILAEQTATEWALETVARWRLAQYAAPRAVRQNRLGRLVSAPDLATFDPTLVIALESVAEGTDAIQFSPASVLASVTDRQQQPDGAALPDTAGPSLQARLDRIAVVDADLDDTASMLPDDDPRRAQWSRRLDSFVSTAFDDDAVEAQLDELVDEAARLRGGVIAPDPFTFTLTGREAQQIDLRIGNALDEPLDVIVRLSSPRLTFPGGDMAVTLAANDTTVVKVPVIARSNGTSGVTVDVLTPDGQRPLIEPVRLTGRVNALTGIGQVLTAAFVLILASWWISSWRSKRRARDDDGSVEHPTAGSVGSAGTVATSHD